MGTTTWHQTSLTGPFSSSCGDASKEFSYDTRFLLLFSCGTNCDSHQARNCRAPFQNQDRPLGRSCRTCLCMAEKTSNEEILGQLFALNRIPTSPRICHTTYPDCSSSRFNTHDTLFYDQQSSYTQALCNTAKTPHEDERNYESYRNSWCQGQRSQLECHRTRLWRRRGPAARRQVATSRYLPRALPRVLTWYTRRLGLHMPPWSQNILGSLFWAYTSNA